MFGTSRFSSGARVAKFQDNSFEMGSRSSSMDGASSNHSSAVGDPLELSEPPIPRMTFAGILPSTLVAAAPPIDAPQNKSKFTGTVSSASKRPLSFASIFMRSRKQRQSSMSSLSSVNSTGYQLL